MKNDISVFVFATIWPSWLVASQACGFQKNVVHVEDATPSTKRVITKNLQAGNQLVDKDEWFHSLKLRLQNLEAGEKMVVLIQGPETTALKVKRWLERNVGGGSAGKGVLVIAGLTAGEPDRLQFEGHGLERAGKK